jgi:hypothetical protein
MSDVSDVETVVKAGLTAVKGTYFPWMIVAFFISVLGSGGTGAYFGYGWAAAKNTSNQLALVAAQNTAINAKDALIASLQASGNKIEGDFENKLGNLHVTNTTVQQQIRTETQKLVYTDCKLPDSGVDLLNKHIDDVNLILLQSSTAVTK